MSEYIFRKQDEPQNDHQKIINKYFIRGYEQALSDLHVNTTKLDLIPEGYAFYNCTNCKKLNVKFKNKDVRAGFCDYCNHPLWN